MASATREAIRSSTSARSRLELTAATVSVRSSTCRVARSDIVLMGASVVGGLGAVPAESGTAPRLSLERRQVALELPLAHLHAVLVPLVALERDQSVAQLEAERLLDQRRLLGQVDRLAERLGQRLDPERVPLRLRQRVQVGLHRVGQL